MGAVTSFVSFPLDGAPGASGGAEVAGGPSGAARAYGAAGGRDRARPRHDQGLPRRVAGRIAPTITTSREAKTSPQSRGATQGWMPFG